LNKETNIELHCAEGIEIIAPKALVYFNGQLFQLFQWAIGSIEFNMQLFQWAISSMYFNRQLVQ
jgi:hypothetical protein